MPFGRGEVDEAVRAQALLLGAGAHQHLAVEDHDQGVLVDLVVGQALALRQDQQDDAVGIVVRAQDARRVRLDRLGIKLPELHVRLAAYPGRRRPRQPVCNA